MLKNALVIAVLALGGAAVFASCSSKTDCPEGASHCACKVSQPFCNNGLTCMDNICINPGVVNMMGMGGMAGTGGSGVHAGGSSGTGSGGSTGAPEVCTSTADATVCRKCIDSSCCNEFNACLKDSLDCRRLISCLGNCNDGDSVCQDNCVNASSDQGVNTLVNLFMCIDKRCTTAMGGTSACDPEPAPDGGVKPPVGDGGAMCTHPTNANACRLCLDDKCCAYVQQCVSASSPCGQFGTCLDKCMDAACETMCAMQFPAGVQPLDGLSQCGDMNCAAACAAPPM
jgi:hypothetical protein